MYTKEKRATKSQISEFQRNLAKVILSIFQGIILTFKESKKKIAWANLSGTVVRTAAE